MTKLLFRKKKKLSFAKRDEKRSATPISHRPPFSQICVATENTAKKVFCETLTNRDNYPLHAFVFRSSKKIEFCET